MPRALILLLLAGSPLLAAGDDTVTPDGVKACAQMVLSGFRKIAGERDMRFTGKVAEATALCRGGERALQFRMTPWVDWSHYWGTGDMFSLPKGPLRKSATFQGVSGALLDLEYERVELIKFNLFDNSGTWKKYVTGLPGVQGPSIRKWPEMRLPANNPSYQAVGGDGDQACKGDLVRARTLTGICNDPLNPLMGSTGMPFARNVEFETTFPDRGETELTKNRHGGRLGILKPDPQLISRKLFTRIQSDPAACNGGFGLPDDSLKSNCDYQRAPFFNVLAAYWIQFMTHDWFAHTDDGHNADGLESMGCTDPEAQKLGCRPDLYDKPYVSESAPPEKFAANGKEYLSRAPETFPNNNTAWWDASQIYGYDETSRKRVRRDPQDPAKLLLEDGYLPVLQAGEPFQPQWKGQESVAFPDNWSIGLSFLHNLFAREHDSFVAEFRKEAAAHPDADSGLRDPAEPKRAIRNKDVTPDELFECARLVVAAEIAKIHTIEWTPQLLYDEPLYKAMNANWNGLLGTGDPDATKALQNIIVKNFGNAKTAEKSGQWYSVLASGPGIFGIGSKVHRYDIANPEIIGGGANHFGSPFNFPEEFVTVYRLHALVPDLIEMRDYKEPNRIAGKVPVIDTFEGKATGAMHAHGLADWGLSMGRQELGLLTLHNIPQFMQSITLPRLDTPTKKIDIAALDIMRDRERGVPRFNEFRRQYGLRQLTSFDDFADKTLPTDSPEHKQQMEWIAQLREVYGTHTCDASKIITDAQLNDDGSKIDDCLGHPNGSTVDNVEDVDTVVGWLSEFTRPHGFAISETQFVVFILNASRRLFSDRFFTSSFRPEFYTKLGVDWVNHNGPGPVQMEAGMPNGHIQPVSAMKRVLMRNIPELAPELSHVVNAFDPWGRDRGQYYTLDWKPRPDAAGDPSFPQK
ncbi:MAG: oxygenase [Acidobacteriota bacterium]|nr:oxygenase [Acidobacteriota bacterium]